MKIKLCAIEKDLAKAWRDRLGAYQGLNVEVFDGDILLSGCDAVVSPANSYGFMDGGIDLVYSRHFGWHVQELLQKLIKELPFKELLVGQAMPVPTLNKAIPLLIAAPTMTIPQPIPAINIYLAVRAAVDEGIRKGLKVLSIPGMGTGTGRVPYPVAADAMLLGISHALKPCPFPVSLRELHERGL